jgi:predicted restriction endonuclease
LQCLNGAYLSEVDSELSAIVLSTSYRYSYDNNKTRSNTLAVREVNTSEQFRELKARLGQEAFSREIRHNYNHACCFPGCEIVEDKFLVAGHIARWADNDVLRGQTSNGICLCLMHDKAFESGIFTITRNFEVWVNQSKALQSTWAAQNIIPFHSHKIFTGAIKPSLEALQEHWARHQIIPS